MNFIIRQEIPSDYPFVFEVVKSAFEDEEYSDHTEHFLVERLRKSIEFIPELSLVAVLDNEIVGHILLSPIKIVNKHQSFVSLALAPVSVKPEFQGKGIGSALIKGSHKKAIDLGFDSIVLIGHEEYYPRFGYEMISKFNIEIPFDAPAENCMILELKKNALDKVSGKVVYPAAFFG